MIPQESKNRFERKICFNFNVSLVGHFFFLLFYSSSIFYLKVIITFVLINFCMFSTLHSVIFLWVTNANTKLRIKLANYHNINIDINLDLMHFNFSVRLNLELCCQSQFCFLYQGSKTHRSPEFMHPALSTKWLL